MICRQLQIQKGQMVRLPLGKLKNIYIFEHTYSWPLSVCLDRSSFATFWIRRLQLLTAIVGIWKPHWLASIAFIKTVGWRPVIMLLLWLSGVRKEIVNITAASWLRAMLLYGLQQDCRTAARSDGQLHRRCSSYPLKLVVHRTTIQQQSNKLAVCSRRELRQTFLMKAERLPQWWIIKRQFARCEF